VTQRPYTSKPAWLTTRNDMPTGKRYAWANRSAALGAWNCDYSVLTMTELGTLFDFFCKVGGKYKPFTFHDPNDNTDHTNCRFDMDALQIRYLGAGQCATSTQIVEFHP
jgi:hypothetical protein